MPNHYHLLVHTPEGNLSRCMRHINGVYTQRFNRQNKKEGQLFRGRYKAVLVDKDNYLLEVLWYIHRNHLKAGFVNTLLYRVEIPESKALAPDVDKVISIVCEHYNVTKQEMLYSRRGTENIARDIAIYLVRRLCNVRHCQK